jgi:arylsulfatase
VYDVAQAQYPKEFKGKAITPIEGRSLVPIFKTGKRDGHEAIYFEHENHKAVRMGKWKLVAKARGPWELYDMEADRTETNDLAAAEPARVEAMKGMWQAWAKRCDVLDRGKRPAPQQ